ncbi:amino acid deaminase [Nordella sp. HKS 07]|uniref:amino acid deaminase n=1 Tax=Nordella sp. HKS 07 TaxID=2712222 RepID=UPI0013E1B9D8|nr:amino acid deaminase [Nordella sp. HKS 07]QIG47401.1 amino acid deaminase [Nordella sp. HKS 07]
MTTIDLTAIEAFTLDRTVKGMPGDLSPLALKDIGKRGWNVLREDLPLPLAVMRESAIAHNSEWMRRYLKATGADIAPHGKTTMSPQLFSRQVTDGAWAITIGSVEQLQVARQFGFQRLLLANQPVGAKSQRYVVEELKRDKDFDFYCFVDSVDLVRQLSQVARDGKLDRPLQVIIEGGFVGGRTGCRTHEEALAVARAVKAAAPYLSLRGVGGYEGLLRRPSPDESAKAVDDFLTHLLDIALGCDREDLFGAGDVLLTAGGTVFYDLVTRHFSKAKMSRPFRVVLRCGCYLTHDSASYVTHFEQLRARNSWVDDLGPGPQAALEVWAYVQSRPEAGKVLLTVGRRDISFDSAMPTPLKWIRPAKGATAADLRPIGPDHVVTGLNDQHCHLQIPETSPLAVGDMVAFGISHPCTTFDKWQVICVVDDDYNVVSAIRTFF